MATGRVVAVASAPGHHFSKAPQLSVRLIAGHGIAGDAHAGPTVKHRYLARQDPLMPNIRQVHLIDTGLIAHVAALGFTIRPGDIGENLVVEGLDQPLVDLPKGTQIALGATARIRLTGLRTPCKLIDRFQPGLMSAMLDRSTDGMLRLLAGVMAVVEADGDVAPGDPVTVTLPPAGERRALPRL